MKLALIDSKVDAGISYYDKFTLHQFFKIGKECENKTKLLGYLYTDESEKQLVDRKNLTIEMEGDNAFEYDTAVDKGTFSVDEMISGKYTVNVVDAKTHLILASQEIEILKNTDNIIKFYLNDIPEEQEYETFILRPGDSYRFTCKEDDSLHVRAKQDTVYERYTWEGIDYQTILSQGSEFYIPRNIDEFVELKVLSGEMEVFVLQGGGFNQEPDKDLSESFTILDLDGAELFNIVEVNAGETITIDFPVDGQKGDLRKIWGTSDNVTYEYDCIDYFWNKQFGTDIKTETYSDSGVQDFWFILSNYEKRVFRVTEGTLTLIYHRDDTDLEVF